MDILDVEYAPDLYLDVVAPPDASEPLPAIVWLHGGGWRLQDRKARPDFARHFAERGFVMVSIDYRLTPDTIFPGQLHDVRKALRWIRSHAEEYGIDPSRIGLWGSSAGGHLAALAGAHSSRMQLPGEEPSEISAAVQVVAEGYGPVFFDDQRDDSPEAFLLGGPIRDNPELARAANPAKQVRPGMPPFLILHGTADTMVPHTNSIALFDALAAAGNEATLYLVGGFGHGFLNPGDVLELGPGVFLDQGRLEANPDSPAEIHSTTTTTRHGTVSMGTIADFFTVHLGQGSPS
ncbi:alpha/beta hydrolase [Rhodococcus sp. G-MC3]|uniref:alpha/beta hydrolase n=1 Tax=Rhodococcus sp. G-MC3 TaxID=3046209 RepID=UPI0024BB44A0|nr:alpha/beta hydrolase [Rhodococcus sp. G-MC3]MDJ0394638.1 alpha/beta hydrolase [Rhodococcus sp. G-MC3]